MRLGKLHTEVGAGMLVWRGPADARGITMRFRKSGVAMALALAILGAAGAAGAAGVGAKASGPPIPVGVLVPLTGAGSPYGPGMLDAVKIAAKQINAAGGVMGRPIRLFSADTETNPDATVKAGEQLIQVDHVVAIIGTWASTDTLALVPITDRAGIIEMSTSGAPELATLKTHGLTWRTQASDLLYGQAFARAAYRRGYRVAATLSQNSPFGLGIVDQFDKTFRQLGGKIVGDVVYNFPGTSYTTQVSQVLAKKPQIVILGSYEPDAAIILKEWYQTGIPMHFLGPAFAINQQLVQAVGARVANGVLAIDTVPNLKARTYLNLTKPFAAMAHESLFSDPYAAQTYDQMISLALAMEAAHSTNGHKIGAKMTWITNQPGVRVYSYAQGLKTLLAHKKIDYIGASSNLNWKANGAVRPDFGVFKVEGGKLVLTQVVAP